MEDDGMGGGRHSPALDELDDLEMEAELELGLHDELGRSSWPSDKSRDERQSSNAASSEQGEEDEEGWMVTPLATLAARGGSSVSQSAEHTEEGEEEDVEASVRAALRLLEQDDDSDALSEQQETERSALRETGRAADREEERSEEVGDEDEEEWRRGLLAEGGKSDYFGFVHEAMEARWSQTSSPRGQLQATTIPMHEQKERQWMTALTQADALAHLNGGGHQVARKAESSVQEVQQELSSDEDADNEYSKDHVSGSTGSGGRQQSETRQEDQRQIEEQQQSGDEQEQSFDKQETEDQNGRETDGSEDGEDEEQDEEQEEKVEDPAKTEDDEWQEAYTAKGRVYYYNRRTRESSWKKPSNYTGGSNQPQATATATDTAAETTESPHRSILQQSLGYRPSPSASTAVSMERQTSLFCCFCGDQQPSERFATHFQECSAASFHKRRNSPLYASFERALGLLSEDASLRSLHYASSFPDATPHVRPGAASVQDSLLLLRPRRRYSTSRPSTARVTTVEKPRSQHQVTHAAARSPNPSPDRGPPHSTTQSSMRRATEAPASRRKKATSSAGKRRSSQLMPRAFSGPATPQYMETCRYCSRSFAEGRLAKHEAVCPRVFGTEGSWGRGVPAAATVASSPTASPPHTAHSRKARTVGVTKSSPSRHDKLKEHNLQQSFKEHQATLVVCPCCRRKFAPSGAQQHIAICKGVQNRPKNPIPLLRDYAMAG